MCTNKRWVRNQYTGKYIFVNCGHCPACRQQKADHMAQKIRNNDKDGYIALFVHLTYANSCLPYIRKSELKISPSISERVHQDSINVYRDSVNRRIRTTTDYQVEKHRVSVTHKIGELCDFDCPTHDEYITFHVPTNMDDSDKLSVIYYSDVQKFIKRLSIYVKRRNEISQKYQDFSYFITSEYGETNSRSHFHLLIFVKAAAYKYWKCAIAANWLYDDYNFTFKNIQIAKSAAAYAASYINCDTFLSPFLLQKTFCPKRSHSLHFGQNIPAFSLDSLLQKIRERDLRYSCKVRGADGVLRVDNILIPSYVFRRYFPLFKGYSRINDDAIFEVALRPQKLSPLFEETDFGLIHQLEYYLKTDSDGVLIQDDFYSNFVMLCNARSRFILEYLKLYPNTPSSDLNLIYARYYLAYLKAKRSTLWKIYYEGQNESFFNQSQSYDNISFFAGHYDSPALQSLQHLLQLGYDLYMSPNEFYSNVQKTFNYEQKYYKFNKQHRCNDVKYQIIKYGKTNGSGQS